MKIFVLAAVLLVLALGVAFLFRVFPSERTQPTPLPADVVAAEPTLPAPPLEPVPSDPKLDSGLADPAAPVVARTGADSSATASAATTKIIGRVQIAGACSDDDRLQVFALPFDADGVIADWALDDTTGDKSKSFVIARAPVDHDGRFEIALPADEKRVSLVARGRYAFMRESVPAKIGATEPIMLVTECGACISGTFAPPSGLEALSSGLENVDVDVKTSFEGGAADFAGMDRTERTVKVHAGRFEIHALDPKFGYDVALMPEKLAATNTTVTDLSAGRTKTVDIALQRGGALHGTVKGPGGTPIADATVSAKRKGHFFGIDDVVVRSGKTDANGAFALEAVWPGHVLVNATAAGMLDGDPLSLDLVDGVVRTDLVLAMGQGKSVAGTVAWSDGKPAVGVDVNVEFDKSQMAGLGAFNARRGAKGKAQTDAAGHFEITGLGAGPFTVKAQAVSPEDMAQHGDPTGKLVSTDYLQRARKDGVKPGTTDLALKLVPPQGLRGRVVDAALQPVAEFHIHATSVGIGMLANVGQDEIEKDFKDGTGAFLLAIPREGAWRIRVDSAGYSSNTPLEIKLPLAADAAPLVITLDKGAVVRGIVQDPHGVPVLGATVSLQSGDPNWKRMMSGEKELSAKSIEGGAFTLEGLHAGHSVLVADSKTWAHNTPFDIDLGPGETREGVVLVLREGGKLTGEVYDGGKAAAGMLVQAILMKTSDQKMGTSDGQGRFELAHLDAGTYQVIAMPTSALATNDDGSGVDQGALMSKLKMTSTTITEGQETHVVLGAPPQDPVKVHGRVTHSGAPFSGAMVMFIAEGKNVLASMKTATVGADGSYALTIDGPGKFAVTVQRMSGKPGEQSSIEFRETIPAEKDFELDLEMPTARISGTVRDVDGTPVDGVTVILHTNGGLETGTIFGGQFHSTSTDSDGRFDLDALRPGAYAVSAGGNPFGIPLSSEGAHHARKSQDVHLAEGEWRKDVDLRLDKPGTVTVTVVDEGGNPVADASVFARDEHGQLVDFLSMIATGGDGTAKYAGLAPGRHTFSARTKDHATGESPAIDVESDATKSVKITLTPATMLVVRVLDAEAKPTQAFVSVTDESGHEVAMMMTMAELQERFTAEGGSISGDETRIGPLAPGKYRVRATRPDGKSVDKPVKLDGKAEEKVKLRFGE